MNERDDPVDRDIHYRSESVYKAAVWPRPSSAPAGAAAGMRGNTASVTESASRGRANARNEPDNTIVYGKDNSCKAGA